MIAHTPVWYTRMDLLMKFLCVFFLVCVQLKNLNDARPRELIETLLADDSMPQESVWACAG